MVQFSFVITLLSTSLAALLLLFGFSSAKSAPQEASIAALACAMAIIPYVFSRCIQINADRNANAEALKRIADLLEAQRARSPEPGWLASRGESPATPGPESIHGAARPFRADEPASPWTQLP